MLARFFAQGGAMDGGPAPLKQNRLLGIGLRIGAATSFGFMAAMIKLGDEAGVSLAELAFYRFAFGLPPLLAWIAWTGNFNAWRTQRPLRFMNVSGFTSSTCSSPSFVSATSAWNLLRNGPHDGAAAR